MSAAIRIGTRGSALAMAQAHMVAAALERAGATVEMVAIQTAGDRRAPDTPWGEGAFVGAIEQALSAGDVDVAVHSAKDMPTAEPADLEVVAYLPRADARDALVLPAGAAPAALDDLPAGARIGTDSPRRAGFLRARRPDLEVVPIHGNVDTRLRRLDEGEADALVLASAGLERLGRGDRISQRFEPELLPPAPGQGAIAIQARADDARLAELGRLIDDAPTRTAVEAERTFLAATGGGCRAPVGALASVSDGELALLGGYATTDGRHAAVAHETGAIDDALLLAERLARQLVAHRAQLAGGRQVLLTRPEAASARLASRLAEHGLGAAVVPAIDVRLRDDDGLQTEMTRLAEHRWAIVTSVNGARAAREAAHRAGVSLGAGRWAAVGRGSAEALGLPRGSAVWRPSRALGEALGAELPLEPGDPVLLIRGNLADASLPAQLSARGAVVNEVVAYETLEGPRESEPLLADALRDDPAAVVFASPSAVRGLLSLARDDDARARLLALPAICIGPQTARAAAAAGFSRVTESPDVDASIVAETVATTVAASRGAVDVGS